MEKVSQKVCNPMGDSGQNSRSNGTTLKTGLVHSLKWPPFFLLVLRFYVFVAQIRLQRVIFVGLYLEFTVSCSLFFTSFSDSLPLCCNSYQRAGSSKSWFVLWLVAPWCRLAKPCLGMHLLLQGQCHQSCAGAHGVSYTQAPNFTKPAVQTDCARTAGCCCILP
jgi:hypothetical protein